MSAEFAGRLRVRAALSRPDASRDALGAPGGGWIDRGTVWAAVEREGRGDLALADRRTAWPLWRLTMRPHDIVVGDRLEWGAATALVREVRADPTLPDRMVVIAEEGP